jgi:hypothetical protein
MGLSFLPLMNMSACLASDVDRLRGDLSGGPATADGCRHGGKLG